jgi:hypothetical protein
MSNYGLFLIWNRHYREKRASRWPSQSSGYTGISENDARYLSNGDRLLPGPIPDRYVRNRVVGQPARGYKPGFFTGLLFAFVQDDRETVFAGAVPGLLAAPGNNCCKVI